MSRELMTVEMFSELPMQHSHVLLFLVYWKAEEFRSFWCWKATLGGICRVHGITVPSGSRSPSHFCPEIEEIVLSFGVLSVTPLRSLTGNISLRFQLSGQCQSRK